MRDYALAKGAYELETMIANSCYMDHCRDILVDNGRDKNPDYMLWLDADQVYPPNTPEVLMKHVDDGKLVVGGVTPRRDDGLPLVYKRTGKNVFARTHDIATQVGVKQVDGMGMGGVMTHPKVFDKLEKPYFMMRWQNGAYIGEDIRFYEKCYRADVKVWCDTDLIYEHLDMYSKKLKGLKEER